MFTVPLPVLLRNTPSVVCWVMIEFLIVTATVVPKAPAYANTP
jgi:hypothetical protein